ncbi:sensor domain-containing protein [Aurantivibrio plasticivorans]
MHHLTASVGVSSVSDDVLLDRAMAATQAVLWSWAIEGDSLNFSPHFYQQLNIPQGSLKKLDDLARYLSVSDHQALCDSIVASTIRACPIGVTVTLQVSGSRYPLSFYGGVQQLSPVENIVTGLVHIGSADQSSLGNTALAAQYDQRLSQCLDVVHDGLWCLDRHGQIIFENQAAIALLDSNPHSGERLFDVLSRIFPEAYWDVHDEEIPNVLSHDIGSIGYQQVVPTEHGIRNFTIDKTPFKNERNDIVGVIVTMTDSTEVTEQRSQLQASEQRYQAVFSASHDVIWCFEIEPPVDINLSVEQQVDAIVANAHLVECNQHFAELYGDVNPEQLLGTAIPTERFQNYRSRLEGFVREGYQLVDKPGERFSSDGHKEFWQVTTVGTVEGDFLIRIWGTSKNVTDRKRYLEKLEYQATHDSLTNLPNRVMLYNEIEQAMQTRKQHQLMALLIIDLDGFKEINDTLGHHVGDKVLQLLGPRLEAEMEHAPGIVTRLGGDEFAIFLSNIRNQQQAIVFGHRVLDAVQQPFMIEGYHSEIGASIGIAISPNQASDLTTMMRYADVAMYKAKKEQLGVTLYHPDADPHSPKRLSLMGDLGKAIREEQLLLHYQPKLSLVEHRPTGVEALIRWQHPELGMVSPGEFIPIAESTGLIHPMTLWVLEEAIKQCKAWENEGIFTSIAVNLSTRNLMDDDIVDSISNLLTRHSLKAECLELEITESSIMEDPKRALHILNNIHALGVRLSIDDFGTGYSSLSYLKKLPVDALKIDFSFVINMLEDEQDRIIVNSTINLAHNLGLKVVAEGVESQAALQQLSRMGCDYAQGFYISKPIPAGPIQDWMRPYWS